MPSCSFRRVTFPQASSTSLAQRRPPRRNPQYTLSYELDLHLIRYYARFVTAREQRPHRFSTGLAVVQGPLVDVHRDEPVRQSRGQVAGIVEGVGQRLLAVVEGVSDAGLDQARHLADGLFPEVASYDVAAQRQGQARLGVPPLAQ